MNGGPENLALGVQEHGFRDRSAAVVAVVQGHAGDAGKNVQQLETQGRSSSEADREVAPKLVLGPDRAVRPAEALDDQGGGELERIRVVGQDSLHVVRIPGRYPLRGDGFRFLLVHVRIHDRRRPLYSPIGGAWREGAGPSRNKRPG